MTAIPVHCFNIRWWYTLPKCRVLRQHSDDRSAVFPTALNILPFVHSRMPGMEDVLFITIVVGLPIALLISGCYLLWSGFRASADRLWPRQREQLLALGLQPVR